MFLQMFSFTFRHNPGIENRVEDALSCKKILLTQLQTEIIGLEFIKELYEEDLDFVVIWKLCKEELDCEEFSIRQGYLFKINFLCIHVSSWRKQIVGEAHGGGLATRVGRDNTFQKLQARFFWPRLYQDIFLVGRQLPRLPNL